MTLARIRARGAIAVNDIAQTPYELLGGAEALRRLTDRFYDVMDEAPEATALRAMSFWPVF